MGSDYMNNKDKKRNAKIATGLTISALVWAGVITGIVLRSANKHSSQYFDKYYEYTKDGNLIIKVRLFAKDSDSNQKIYAIFKDKIGKEKLILVTKDKQIGLIDTSNLDSNNSWTLDRIANEKGDILISNDQLVWQQKIIVNRPNIFYSGIDKNADKFFQIKLNHELNSKWLVAHFVNQNNAEYAFDVQVDKEGNVIVDTKKLPLGNFYKLNSLTLKEDSKNTKVVNLEEIDPSIRSVDKTRSFDEEGNVIVNVRVSRNLANKTIQSLFEDENHQIHTLKVVVDKNGLARLPVKKMDNHHQYKLIKVTDENDNDLLKPNKLSFAHQNIIYNPIKTKIEVDENNSQKLFHIQVDPSLQNQSLTITFKNENHEKTKLLAKVNSDGEIVIDLNELKDGHLYKLDDIGISNTSPNKRVANLKQVYESAKTINKLNTSHLNNPYNYDKNGNLIFNAKIDPEQLANDQVEAVFVDENNTEHKVLTNVDSNGKILINTSDLNQNHTYQLKEIVNLEEPKTSVLNNYELASNQKQKFSKPAANVKALEDKNFKIKLLNPDLANQSIVVTFEDENHQLYQLNAKLNDQQEVILKTKDDQLLPNNHTYTLTKITNTNNQAIVNVNDLDKKDKLLEKIDVNKLQQLNAYNYDDLGNLIVDIHNNQKVLIDHEYDAHFIDENNKDHFIPTKIDLNTNKISINTKHLYKDHHYHLSNIVDKKDHKQILLDNDKINALSKISIIKPLAIIKQDKNKNLNLQSFDKNLINRQLHATFVDENQKEYHVKAQSIVDSLGRVQFITSDEVLPNHHKYQLTAINYNNQKVINVNDLDQKQIIINKLNVGKIDNNQLVFDVPNNVEEGEDVFVNYHDSDGNVIKIPAIVNNHQVQVDLTNNPQLVKDKIYHFDSLTIEDEYHVPKETVISLDDVNNLIKTLNNTVDSGRKIIAKNPKVIQNKPTILSLTINDFNKLVSDKWLKLTIALKNDPTHTVSAYGLIDYKNDTVIFNFNHLKPNTSYYIKDLSFRNNDLNVIDIKKDACSETKINIIKNEIIGYTFVILSSNTLVLENYHQYETNPSDTKLNLNISKTDKEPKTVVYRLLDVDNNPLEPDLFAKLDYDANNKFYNAHLQNLKANSKYLIVGFNDQNNQRINYSTPIKTPLIFGTTPHAVAVNFDANNNKQIIKAEDARLIINFVDQDQKLQVGNLVELTYLNKNNHQVYKTVGYVKNIDTVNKSGELEFELNNLISNNDYELLELNALSVQNDAYQKVIFDRFDQNHNQFTTKLIGTYIESINSNDIIKKNENKLDVNVKISFSQKDKTLNNAWAQLVYISKDNEVCLSQPLKLNVNNSNYTFTLLDNNSFGFLRNRVYKFVKLVYAQDKNDLQSTNAIIKNSIDLSHGFKTEPTGSISLKNNDLKVIKRSYDNIKLQIPLVDNDHVLIDNDGSSFVVKVSDLNDPNNIFDGDNQKIVIDQNGNRSLEFDVPNTLLNHKYHINSITLTNKPINAAFDQNENHQKLYELNNSQSKLSEFGNELLVNAYNYEPAITNTKTNTLNYKIKLTLKRSSTLMNDQYLKLKYVDNNGEIIWSNPVSINSDNNEYELNLPHEKTLKSNRIYKFDGLYYFKNTNDTTTSLANKVNMNKIVPVDIQTASRVSLDAQKVIINNITPASADLLLPLVSNDDVFSEDQVVNITIGNKENNKNDQEFITNLEYDASTKTWMAKIHASNLSQEVNYHIKSFKFKQKPILGAFNVNDSNDNHVLIDDSKTPSFSTPKASFDLVSVIANDVIDSNVNTNNVNVVINNDGTSLNNCKAKVVYSDGKHEYISDNYVVLNFGINEYSFHLNNLKHNRVYTFKKLIYTQAGQDNYQFSFLNTKKVQNIFKTASINKSLVVSDQLIRKTDSNSNKINLNLKLNDPNDFLEQDSILEITFHDEKDHKSHHVIGKVNVDANNKKTLEFSVENTDTFKIQTNHKYVIDNISYATNNHVQPAHPFDSTNKNRIYDANQNPNKTLSFTNELIINNIKVNKPNENLDPSASLDVELKCSENLLKDKYLRALYIDNNHQKVWSDYVSVNDANLESINFNFNHLTPNRKLNFAGIYYFDNQNQNNDESQGKKIVLKQETNNYDFNTPVSNTKLLDFKATNIDEDRFNYDFSVNDDDRTLEAEMPVELYFEDLTDKNQPIVKVQTKLTKKDERSFSAHGLVDNLLATHSYRLVKINLKQKPRLANLNINNSDNNEIILNSVVDNQKIIQTLAVSIVNKINNLETSYTKNANGTYDVKFNINIIKNSNKINNKYVKLVFEDNEHQLISTNGVLVNNQTQESKIDLENFSFNDLKPNKIYRLQKVVYSNKQDFDAINEIKNTLVLNASLANTSFSTIPSKIKVRKNNIDVWQNEASINLILDDVDNQLHSGDEISINYRVKGTQNILSNTILISDSNKKNINCRATNLVAGVNYEIVSVTIKSQKNKNTCPVIFELPSDVIDFYTLAPFFKINNMSITPVYYENKNTADLKISLWFKSVGASLINKDIKFIFKRKHDGKEISFINKITSDKEDVKYEWEFKDLLRNREYTLERVVYLKDKDFSHNDVSEKDYTNVLINDSSNTLTFKLLPTKPLSIIGAPIKEISDNGAKVQLKFAIEDHDDILKNGQTFKFNIQPNENNGASLSEISEHDGKIEIVDGQKFFVINVNNIKVNKEYKVYKIYFDENQDVGNGVYKINFKNDYKEPNNVVYDASVNTTQTYVFTNKFAIASFSNNLSDVNVTEKQNISINLDSRSETIEGYHFKAKYISNDNRVVWTNTIPSPTNSTSNKNNIPLTFELDKNQLIPNRLYTFAGLYYSKDANVDEKHANMVVIKNSVNPQTISTKLSSTYISLKTQKADENRIDLSLLLHSNDQIFEDKNSQQTIAKISIDELDVHDQIVGSSTHDYDLTLQKEGNEWLLKTQLFDLKPNTKYRVKKVWFTNKPSENIYTNINKDNIIYPINEHKENIDLKTLNKSTLNSVKPTKVNFDKNDLIKLTINFNKTGSSLENKYAKLVYKNNANQEIESNAVLLNWDVTTKQFNKEFSFNNNQTGLVANRDFEFVKLVISDYADFKNAKELELTSNFNKEQAKFSINPTPIIINNVVQTTENTYDQIHLSFDYDDQDHNLVDNSQITITYRKKGDQNWITSKSDEVSVKNGKINVALNDLTPNTTYEIGVISTTHINSPNTKISPIQYNDVAKKQLEKINLTTKVANNFITNIKINKNPVLVNGVYECAKDQDVNFSVDLHKEGNELDGYDIYVKFVDKTDPNKPIIEVKSTNAITQNQNQIYQFQLLKSQITPNHKYELSEICAIRNKGASDEYKKDLNKDNLSLILGLAPTKMDVQKPTISVLSIENTNKVSAHVKYIINDHDGILNATDCQKELLNIKYALFNETQNPHSIINVPIKYDQQTKQFYCEFNINNLTLNQNYGIFEISFANKPTHAAFAKINDTNKPLALLNTNNQDENQKINLSCEVNKIEIKEQNINYDQNTKISWPIQLSSNLLNNKYVRIKYSVSGHKFKQTDQFTNAFKIVNNKVNVEINHDKLIANKTYEIEGIYFSDQSNDFACTNANQIKINSSIVNKKVVVNPSTTAINNHQISNITSTSATVNCSVNTNDGNIFEPSSQIIGYFAKSDNLTKTFAVNAVITKTNNQTSINFTLNNLEPNTKYTLVNVQFKQQPNSAYLNINNDRDNKFYSHSETNKIDFTTSSPILEINTIKATKNVYGSNKEEININANFNKIDSYLNAKKLKLIYQTQNNGEVFETKAVSINSSNHNYTFSFDKNASNKIIGNREYTLAKILYLNEHDQWCELNKNNVNDQFSIEPTPISIANIVEDDSKRSKDVINFRIYFKDLNEDKVFNENDEVNVKLVYPNTNNERASHNWQIHFDQQKNKWYTDISLGVGTLSNQEFEVASVSIKQKPNKAKFNIHKTNSGYDNYIYDKNVNNKNYAVGNVFSVNKIDITHPSTETNNNVTVRVKMKNNMKSAFKGKYLALRYKRKDNNEFIWASTKIKIDENIHDDLEFDFTNLTKNRIYDFDGAYCVDDQNKPIFNTNTIANLNKPQIKVLTNTVNNVSYVDANDKISNLGAKTAKLKLMFKDPDHIFKIGDQLNLVFNTQSNPTSVKQKNVLASVKEVKNDQVILNDVDLIQLNENTDYELKEINISSEAWKQKENFVAQKPHFTINNVHFKTLKHLFINKIEISKKAQENSYTLKLSLDGDSSQFKEKGFLRLLLVNNKNEELFYTKLYSILENQNASVKDLIFDVDNLTWGMQYTIKWVGVSNTNTNDNTEFKKHKLEKGYLTKKQDNLDNFTVRASKPLKIKQVNVSEIKAHHAKLNLKLEDQDSVLKNLNYELELRFGPKNNQSSNSWITKKLKTKIVNNEIVLDEIVFDNLTEDMQYELKDAKLIFTKEELEKFNKVTAVNNLNVDFDQIVFKTMKSAYVETATINFVNNTPNATIDLKLNGDLSVFSKSQYIRFEWKLNNSDPNTKPLYYTIPISSLDLNNLNWKKDFGNDLLWNSSYTLRIGYGDDNKAIDDSKWTWLALEKTAKGNIKTPNAQRISINQMQTPTNYSLLTQEVNENGNKVKKALGALDLCFELNDPSNILTNQDQFSIKYAMLNNLKQSVSARAHVEIKENKKIVKFHISGIDLNQDYKVCELMLLTKPARMGEDINNNDKNNYSFIYQNSTNDDNQYKFKILLENNDLSTKERPSKTGDVVNNKGKVDITITQAPKLLANKWISAAYVDNNGETKWTKPRLITTNDNNQILYQAEIDNLTTNRYYNLNGLYFGNQQSDFEQGNATYLLSLYPANLLVPTDGVRIQNINTPAATDAASVSFQLESKDQVFDKQVLHIQITPSNQNIPVFERTCTLNVNSNGAIALLSLNNLEPNIEYKITKMWFEQKPTKAYANLNSKTNNNVIYENTNGNTQPNISFKTKTVEPKIISLVKKDQTNDGISFDLKLQHDGTYIGKPFRLVYESSKRINDKWDEKNNNWQSNYKQLIYSEPINFKAGQKDYLVQIIKDHNKYFKGNREYKILGIEWANPSFSQDKLPKKLISKDTDSEAFKNVNSNALSFSTDATTIKWYVATPKIVYNKNHEKMTFQIRYDDPDDSLFMGQKIGIEKILMPNKRKQISLNPPLVGMVDNKKKIIEFNIFNNNDYFKPGNLYQLISIDLVYEPEALSHKDLNKLMYKNPQTKMYKDKVTFELDNSQYSSIKIEENQNPYEVKRVENKLDNKNLTLKSTVTFNNKDEHLYNEYMFALFINTKTNAEVWSKPIQLNANNYSKLEFDLPNNGALEENSEYQFLGVYYNEKQTHPNKNEIEKQIYLDNKLRIYLNNKDRIETIKTGIHIDVNEIQNLAQFKDGISKQFKLVGKNDSTVLNQILNGDFSINIEYKRKDQPDNEASFSTGACKLFKKNNNDPFWYFNADFNNLNFNQDYYIKSISFVNKGINRIIGSINNADNQIIYTTNNYNSSKYHIKTVGAQIEFDQTTVVKNNIVFTKGGSGGYPASVVNFKLKGKEANTFVEGQTYNVVLSTWDDPFNTRDYENKIDNHLNYDIKKDYVIVSIVAHNNCLEFKNIQLIPNQNYNIVKVLHYQASNTISAKDMGYSLKNAFSTKSVDWKVWKFGHGRNNFTWRYQVALSLKGPFTGFGGYRETIFDLGLAKSLGVYARIYEHNTNNLALKNFHIDGLEGEDTSLLTDFERASRATSANVLSTDCKLANYLRRNSDSLKNTIDIGKVWYEPRIDPNLPNSSNATYYSGEPKTSIFKIDDQHKHYTDSFGTTNNDAMDTNNENQF